MRNFSLLFFQGGGGAADYEADDKLVDSLKRNLGSGFDLHYPQLMNKETPDLGRREQIHQEISISREPVVIVAHSLGASMLLACLSEAPVRKKITAVFLLATPFWSGDADWVKPFKLLPDFANKLDAGIPLYFYHCRDDEEVPFDHLAFYKQQLPWASFREINAGGHQFNNDLTIVANDIKSIL